MTRFTLYIIIGYYIIMNQYYYPPVSALKFQFAVIICFTFMINWRFSVFITAAKHDCTMLLPYVSGKAFAILSVCDNAIPLFSGVLYSQLYNATLNTAPNSIYWLTFSTQIAVLLLILCVVCFN